MPNDNLPPLHPLAAKSFYYALAAMVLPALNQFGIAPSAWFGLEPGSGVALVDLLWGVIVPLVAAWRWWRERAAPNRRLTLRGPLR